MALEIGARLAEVAPVPVDRYGAHGPGLDQPGQEVLAEVAEPAVVAGLGVVELRAQGGERLEEGVGAVDEDLGGDRARARPRHLDLEVGDDATPAGEHGHVVRGLLLGDLGGDQRRGAAAGDVLLDRRHQVHVEDVVGAGDHDVLGPLGGEVGLELEQQVGVARREALLAGGAGAGLRHHPAEPPAVAVQAPGPATGEVAVDRGDLVLHAHPHVDHLGVGQARQREVDEPVHAPEREGGLGPLARQHVHP